MKEDLSVKKSKSSVKEREKKKSEILEGPTDHEIGLRSYGKQRTFL